MDRRRAAGALLALAASVACSMAAPTASNQTALELLDGPSEGCYYNFQHYGEGDRIMTNEPCLNCTCHNRMLMCYLRVCPFTKPIGQDCTIEKRADQCCPIVTCPDVPVDLLTSTSTSSPAEYGATGLGKVDKYGCSINGKYFSEGAKVPPTPNKPCEHCYCIRNMTTCVMQECTLHVDGCTPIYHKDVCCPVRYSCDHQEDEMLLLDDMTTTLRPTPGFLLTTTTMPAVTQMSQDCVHDDQIFTDGASIKTEKACEHCYCMKGDIVCIVQECGTPMENEGKNCTSLPPRQGQCCPDTYICEGGELISEVTDGITSEDVTTLSPPRRVEGSGYRNEPDEPYTEMSTFEGSGEDTATTLDTSDMTSQKQTPQIIDEVFPATEESLQPMFSTIEPDKGQNTVPDDEQIIPDSHIGEKTTLSQKTIVTTQPSIIDGAQETATADSKTTLNDYSYPTKEDNAISKEDELITSTDSGSKVNYESTKITGIDQDIERQTTVFNKIEELTTLHAYLEPSSSEPTTLHEHDDKFTSQSGDLSTPDETYLPPPTTNIPKGISEYEQNNEDKLEQTTLISSDNDSIGVSVTPTTSKTESVETTSVNPVENEIDEDVQRPGRIPGEGDCLLNGITYRNNTNVPNINNCHSSCKCVSSIVKCDPIICSPPPENMDNMNDCQPIYDTPDACCPTYVCHSRETIPPESHNQMSETESPKTTSEKSESECHGNQCKILEITPSPEPCNSENCPTKVQEKECENGVCIEQFESTSDVSPLKPQEECVGETCLPSEELCTDGKCHHPPTSEIICKDGNKCQPSKVEPCIGQNCKDGSELIISKDQPICQDSDGCKGSDSTDISKPSCEGNSECDKIVPDENTQPECTEDNCRRKEPTQIDHKPPTCFGSNCINQEEVKDETSILTTDSPIKEQSSKELTTENIYEGSSQFPDSEEIVTLYESHKVTESVFETTERQKIFSEVSTDKYEVATAPEIDDNTTGDQESYTESSNLFVTKAEEPIIEDHHTVVSETYTTKSDEQATEQKKKDVTTESSITIESEEQFPEKEVSSTTEIFVEPNKITSLLTDIGYHDKDVYDATDAVISEGFTETPTEASNISKLTTKQAETDTQIFEEDTTKQETYTSSPEIHTTNLELFTSETKTENSNKPLAPEKENTLSDLDLAITESSGITNYEKSTEKIEDNEVKDEFSNTGTYETTEASHKDNEQVTKVVGTEGFQTIEIFTTDQSIPIDQSSELYGNKLEEVTHKTYDNSQQDQNLTDKPYETTSHDLDVTEKDLQSPQTTDVTERLDTDLQKTEKPVKDQQEYTELPEIFESVSNKQDFYLTPTETHDYVTSIINLETHATMPSITEDKMVNQENAIPGEGHTVPSDIPIRESPVTFSPQDIDVTESITQHPPDAITTSQDITKIVDIIKDSSIKEDHTDSSIHDFGEMSTKMSDETFLDDTTLQGTIVTESQENTIAPSIAGSDEQVTYKPLTEETSTTGKQITTSSTLLEISTDRSDESTSVPDVQATTFKEVGETISEFITTKRVQSETVTTESLVQLIEETSITPDKTSIETETTTDYDFDKETTEANVMMITEGQIATDNKASIAPDIGVTDNKITIPVYVDENETEETPLISKPDTHNIHETNTELSEQHETILPEEYITKPIDSEIKGEEIHTEYPVLHETEAQNIMTLAPETVTQSQDTETKLGSEYQAEISTSPTHVITQDKEQTESPMSLVTEVAEQSTSSKSIHDEHDSSKLGIDRTTQGSFMSTLSEEKTATSSSHDSDKYITEYPDKSIADTEYDSKSPSHSYTEKQTVTTEYPTSIILDTHKEQVTPSPTTEFIKLDASTELTEKLAPTVEYQEQSTIISNPTTLGSESHSIDTFQESTIMPALSGTSEESLATEEQEIPTKSVEIPTNGKPVPDESDSKVTLQNIAEKQETSIDATTTKSKITEIIEEDHTRVTDKDSQQYEPEQTMSPELFTTTYEETSEKEQQKETSDHKPSIHEENMLSPDGFITTEGLIFTEKPSFYDVELHGTTVSNQDITTKTPLAFDAESEFTTQVYQDLTTYKQTDTLEERLSTIGTIVAESSPITIDVRPHKHTTTIDQLQTEKLDTSSNEQLTPELPEVTKVQEIEHFYTTPQMSTKIAEEESATLLPAKDHLAPEYNTPMSLATEGEVGTIGSQDQGVTEIFDKYTTAGESITVEPIHTEFVDREDLQTELPIKDVTIKDETVIEITGHEDKLPTVESETSLPKETEIEMSTLKETKTSVSVEIQTETSNTKNAETTEPVEIGTELSVPVETVYSVPIESETEIFVQKETERPIPKTTESSAPSATDAIGTTLSDTEIITSIPKETESFVPVEAETESLIEKEPNRPVPIVPETELPVSKETETSVPEITEAYVPEVTEASFPKVTEASVHVVTDAAMSVVTEDLIQSETERASTEVESATYLPKDKESVVPEELPSTSQSLYYSSETTPYLIELQEHTNKFDEGISSVISTDSYTTKSSEIYQTERGDQPIETITDKSTQLDSQTVYTSEGTLILKDEKLSTPSIGPPIDYPTATSIPEEIAHETELNTEKFSVSSESPIVTSSGTKVGENISTIVSDEQSSTIVSTVTLNENEKITNEEIAIETSTEQKDLSSNTEKPSEHEIIHETTASGNELTATKTTTIKIPGEFTTHFPIVHEKPEDKPELPKPGVGEIPATEEIPEPDFPTSGTSGYGQEPDYVEEDQAFGPGTCRYGGKVYVSAQQIPRDDPCDFCFCFRSDIICLQQSCPPPIHGCHEEPIQGFCCPRYECPVSMATTLNVTTTTTTTTTTLPPHFLPHAYKGAAQRRGCQIKGHTYKVGDVVRASSGPCLHCTCGGDGQMKCDPKACTPEPMLRQMIAAAVSAKRRR